MPSSTTSISRIARTALLLSVLPFAFQACKSPLFGLGGKVDTAVPGITIGQVEEGGAARALVNGDYVRGTIVLRGECTDDLGVSSVALSFAETGASVTIAATLDSAGTKWSATINTKSYSDGDKDFTLTVTDSAGKTTSNRFVVYFDNRPPTVMLTVPTATEGTLGAPLYGDVDIKGSVADQFGIRKVRVYLHRSSDRGVVFASPDNASIGTNSFSVSIDTRALLGATGAETGYVNVVATDRSGNENSWFYRFDEIKALNGNVGATVEEIHAVETGRSASANGIDLAEAATARFFKPEAGTLVPDMLAYSFDQNANLPIITVSNPEQGKDADQNILSKTAKAIGLVEDANGVALVEVQFRRLDASLSPWYSDANVGVAGNDLDMSGVGRVVNWNTKTLFGNYGLDQGVQALRIRATDSEGENRTTDWVEFTIDADAPDVTIVSPLAGDYLTGDPIVLTGDAHAYGTSNVGTVEVLIGSTYHAAAITSGAGTPDAAWSFDLTTVLMPTDGLKSLKVRVTDAPTLKQAFYNIVVTVDRTVPTMPTVTSPVRGSSVNGFPTILGSANDGVLLDAVHLVFEKNAEDVLLADTYNWNYQLDAAARANATYGYDLGNNIWRVPIRVRAVDKAGNQRTTASIGGSPTTAPAAGAYYLDVDLEGDKPRIEQVISPGAENTPATAYQIPGSIKVQGTALDDDGLHHVELELIAIINGVTQKFCNLDGTYTSGGGATEVWHTVAGTSLWNVVLNESGGLYELEPGHGGNFLIRVRAWDTKDGGLSADVAGNVTEVYVKFDNTLPGVIGLAPAENSLVRGIFDLDFTAQDNGNVSTAQISYNNGSSYSTLVMTPGASVPFSIPVNTATINSGVFNDSAGTLYIRLKLKDDANNVTEKNLKYLVDNIPPTGDYLDTSGKLSDINDTHYTEGGASLAEAIGVANDIGQVNGVNMVEVYFVRAARVYRLDPTLAASNVAEESYAFSNGTFPYTTAAGYKIVIDDRDEQSNDSGGLGDGDHFDENLTKNAGNYDWSARFDSSKIPDGQVTAHYVVWDEAGNSTHYSETGKVQNNKPSLTGVIVGSDLNADSDATDHGERVRITNAGASSRRYVLDAAGIPIDAGTAFNWATESAITSKNNRLAITLEASGGNPPLAYYAESPNGTALLNWSAGASHTETAFGGAAGWVEDGVNTLALQIRDSAYVSPISTNSVALRITLDNVDGIPPDVATIDSLYWTGESDNSLYGNSKANGHIELVSAYDGADPDVSGQISFHGSANDNQRIQNIRMRITGFDFNDGATAPLPGAWFTVAAWNGSTVVGSDQWAAYGWRFTVSANSPALGGHGLTWQLDWDSSGISGVAQADVLVELEVQDTSFATTGTYLVDVVPYIRSLSTSLSSAYAASPSVFDRSANGHYPVAENETIHLYGFNLDGASTIATIGSTTLAAPLVPDALPRTHLTLNTGNTAVSGNLDVEVSTVPSGNNANSNLRASNLEPNGTNNDLLDDDRYVDIWRFTNVETNIAIKYPIMRISPTGQVGFSYGDIESDFVIRIDAARTVYEVSPSKYAFNTLAFDQATAPNFYALALDTDRTNDGFGGSPRTGANSCTKLNFFSRQLGSANAYPGSYAYGTYKRQLEANWNGYQYNSLRSMYPDMVATSPAAPTDADPTRIYMVYYDQVLSQTKFRYGTVGTNGNTMDYGLALNQDPTIATAIPRIGSAGGANEGSIGLPQDLSHSVYRTGSVTAANSSYYRVVVEPRNTYTFVLDALSANADLRICSDAGFLTQVGSSANAGTTTDFIDYTTTAGMTVLYVQVQGTAAANYRLSYNDRGTASNYQIIGGPNTAYKGGQYAGIGVTTTGIAVVAWYDKPNTRLMYSYNTDPSSGGGNSESQWQSHAAVLDSGFSGWFADLAVDGGNHIHIAYYNASNGDLRYVYLNDYDDPPSAPLTIDSFLSTGTNLTIMTKLVGSDYVPYISYYMNAFTSTKNSLRMAYRTNFAALNPGSGSGDRYTGNWEITSIPATNIPKDHTVSLGFRNLGSALLQPILGYATEANLETAQLK